MATKKPKEEASSSPPAPEPLYHVYLRMQVGSLAGDAGYHVQMTEHAIQSLLDGTATCVRVPVRFGNVTQRGDPTDEYRFLPLSNIVEITIQDLVWPAASYIAEAV